jgi:hypothetical protein
MLARGSLRLPIHLAIHAAMTNRHAHMLFGTRPLNPDGSFGQRVRDFVATVRTCDRGIAVVEAVRWPDFVSEVQESFFAELGIDLTVDLIAPAPMRHLPTMVTQGTAPDARMRPSIQAARERYRDENVRAIETRPSAELVETLLRGRSILSVAALKRLCAKFFYDGGSQHVDRILLDQDIVALTDLPMASKAHYLTTRATYDLLTQAAAIIDRPGQTAVIATTGADEDSVVAQIARLCIGKDLSEPPLILGTTHSHCKAAEAALATNTERSLVRLKQSDDLPAIARKLGLRPGRLVIVPHAERIDDQQLALLIVAAERAGSKLFLGHDQSAKTGIVRRHLAAYVADQLAAPEIPADQEADGWRPTAVSLLLRPTGARSA